MNYHFSKILNSDFDTAIAKITDELKKEGFGIVTDIDMKETLKKKIDVDFRKYRILGACNPKYAYQALLLEDKVGTMLPCNVVVQELTDGRIEVSAVDPLASMIAIENEKLIPLAKEIREKLQRVIENFRN
ncbi:MAG: hypothetical protein A3F72_16950 [Bacteroidetes bacterium RIFCSPLOWO2_12_FULL_35_15]|nr:MAG: hypothetical protein A3F72_16950 [Bacteroidetes bacterium RIFCSPLOWO2_12_FULL_35_15]